MTARMTRRKTMNKPITFKSDLLGETYTVVTHKSGLKIYVFPKDLTSSYCLIATRFGSVDNTFKVGNEESYITVPDGVAHFLEHKLFENEDGEGHLREIRTNRCRCKRIYVIPSNRLSLLLHRRALSFS